jgi:transcriptional regulator with PAS, ATPase and Fis domain
VDVRVISATNKDLSQLMAAGIFREDLFYRIGVIPIHLPPLRQRPEDIPLLVETFIERARLKTKKAIQGVSKKALDYLMNHPWPGNIRELINVIDYTFVVCPEGTIQPEHLPISVTQGPTAVSKAAPVKPKAIDKVVDKEGLLAALNAAAGKKTEAARILGVSRVTLWKWLKEHKIQ